MSDQIHDWLRQEIQDLRNEIQLGFQNVNKRLDDQNSRLSSIEGARTIERTNQQNKVNWKQQALSAVIAGGIGATCTILIFIFSLKG